MSLPLLLPPPKPTLGNLDDSPLSMGNPSNSCSGVDNERGLWGRATLGDVGKDVCAGEGNEGDCDADEDLLDECDLDDFDLAFRGGSLVACVKSEWEECETMCGDDWELR